MFWDKVDKLVTYRLQFFGDAAGNQEAGAFERIIYEPCA